MTLYYSEKSMTNERLVELKTKYPRGEMTSNRLFIKRANTIDNELLLKFYDCAVAKTRNVYNVAITLPISLEYKIPAWIVQGNGDLWVNPKPDLKGQTLGGEEVFITEFHFYVDEKKLHKVRETRNTETQDALIQEFVEVRHALQMGNEEPIDIFRKVYAKNTDIVPKTQVARYLDTILKEE